jgi:hypothetical protein
VTRATLTGTVPDFSWTVMPAATSTISELNLGVVCSNLPALNVLLHKRSERPEGDKTRGPGFGWSLRNLFTLFSTRSSRSNLRSDEMYAAGNNSSGSGSAAKAPGDNSNFPRNHHDVEMASYTPTTYENKAFAQGTRRNELEVSKMGQ